MSEIKAYDKAANRFHDSLDIINLPLTSWDVYASHFFALCKNTKDITSLDLLSKNNQWAYENHFGDALLTKQHVIVVTDSQLRIVHATENIITMNGYSPKEVIGKKPNMFQGPGTCPKTTENIRLAVKNRAPFEAVVLNYRKDGSTYKCWIKGEPIFNTSGKVVNFIAYEKEVA
jgi:PAS domain S-box-containing protein